VKYLCLVYLDKDNWSAVPDRECIDCGDEMRKEGRLLGGEPLYPVDTAKTVRVRDGKRTVMDGPFAETKELLAGFYLVDARDIDEAIELASRIPPVRTGSIEVRPVRELQP
jgi:hypothetical protein